MCAKPGSTFALMFILYGVTRFFLEFVRDDNPIGFAHLTISQNICIVMILFGIALMILFEKMRPYDTAVKNANRAEGLG